MRYRLEHHAGEDQPWVVMDTQVQNATGCWPAESWAEPENAVEALDRLNGLPWYRDAGELAAVAEMFIEQDKADQIPHLIEKAHNYAAEYAEMVAARYAA